jgi:hypothetical protein
VATSETPGGRPADDVAARARTVARLARDVSGSDDPNRLEELEIQVGSLGEFTREAIQTRYREVYLALADKIENGGTLDEQDRRFLGILVTGAANAYLRSENDVAAWRGEIRRIADKLEGAGSAGAPEASDLGLFLEVAAAVEEAKRVVPDLRYYLEEGARVERFRKATETIEPEERPFLARLIRDHLSSPRR